MLPTPTPTHTLTKRQEQLILELRNVESQLAYLTNKRKALKSELERIYPEARDLAPPPPDHGTTITVWNYRTLNYAGTITITPKGREALDSLNPALNNAHFTVLALLLPRPAGADLTKLLQAPVVMEHPNYKRCVKQLDDAGFIHIEFTRAYNSYPRG